ncbi:MAG: hypothetical protein ACREUR_07545 [Nitrosospira sp.]
MKFFRISAARSLASALFMASTVVFGVVGVAHAQYGGSGQGGSSDQGSSAQSSSKDPQSAKEGVDTGYVDQKKKGERAKDGASPSKDTHVPDPPKDKAGKTIADPSKEQGGSIGPN